MSELYELVSESAPPVSLSDMKAYLKIPTTITADDALITSMIGAVTQYGEKYTSRSFRVQTFDLLIDTFSTRICLRRSPVDSIDSVNYTVSGSPVVVASSVYYLKKYQWWSEILLEDGQEWPTDGDEREQGITIQFSTVAYAKAASTIIQAIQMHVAYLYFNRGDCDESSGIGDINSSSKKSGANLLYNQFRISRV